MRPNSSSSSSASKPIGTRLAFGNEGFVGISQKVVALVVTQIPLDISPGFLAVSRRIRFHLHGGDVEFFYFVAIAGRVGDNQHQIRFGDFVEVVGFCAGGVVVAVDDVSLFTQFAVGRQIAIDGGDVQVVEMVVAVANAELGLEEKEGEEEEEEGEKEEEEEEEDEKVKTNASKASLKYVNVNNNQNGERISINEEK